MLRLFLEGEGHVKITNITSPKRSHGAHVHIIQPILADGETVIGQVRRKSDPALVRMRFGGGEVVAKLCGSAVFARSDMKLVPLSRAQFPDRVLNLSIEVRDHLVRQLTPFGHVPIDQSSHQHRFNLFSDGQGLLDDLPSGPFLQHRRFNFATDCDPIYVPNGTCVGFNLFEYNGSIRGTPGPPSFKERVPSWHLVIIARFSSDRGSVFCVKKGERVLFFGSIWINN